MAIQGVEAALEDIVRHALGKGVGLLGGDIEFGGPNSEGAIAVGNPFKLSVAV